MPELPEVETIARGLASRVRGDVIESVWLGSKPEPLKSPAAEIVATLESRRIAGVRRVGKHSVFDLEPAAGVGRAPSPAKGRNRGRGSSSRKKRADEGARPTPQSSAQWIIHLGMTGRMVVSPPESEMAKHTHLVAKLASGRELRFVDPRRFGRLSVAHRLRSLGFRAARGPERPFCQPLPWTKNSHQKCSTEPETFARRGQHLRRRVVVPRRSSPRGGALRRLPGKTSVGFTRRSRKSCGKRLPWAVLPFPIMLTRTVKKDSFSCNTGFMAGKANRAWSVRLRSSGS